MDHKEAGQGTPFDSMSHEDMLAWLDTANSGAIQGASDRLVSAAEVIREIAEELKVRPQTVEWQGEGADAFRTWSADLANATLRLGAYSEGASKWLAQASDAIASAQAAIPRTPAGAQANLDAALAARNDPDASAVAQKSAETLIATQEANRQEAAAEMRKLAQSYALSASQMDGLEKPAFPPPPGAIVPPSERTVGSEQSYVRSNVGGVNDGVGGPPVVASGAAATAVGPTSVPHVGALEGTASASEVRFPSAMSSPVHPVGMSVDSVATLPNAPATSPVGPAGVPVGGKADIVAAPPVGAAPPVLGGGRTRPPGQGADGRTGGGIRPLLQPGQGAAGPGPAARTPRDAGITGGRPVPQNSGRPVGGLSRGMVVGEEGTNGRGPMGHGMGTGGASGAAGRNGAMGGRRLAGESGGMVGGRPQQSVRPSTRPFTPGGSGLVRDGNTSEATRGSGAAGRGAGMAAPASRAGRPRRDESGERPDYLTEDEETWQQGGRRAVPPVID